MRTFSNPLPWTDGIILTGFFLATKLRDTVGAANIDRYLLPAVALIVWYYRDP